MSNTRLIFAAVLVNVANSIRVQAEVNDAPLIALQVDAADCGCMQTSTCGPTQCVGSETAVEDLLTNIVEVIEKPLFSNIIEVIEHPEILDEDSKSDSSSESDNVGTEIMMAIEKPEVLLSNSYSPPVDSDSISEVSYSESDSSSDSSDSDSSSSSSDSEDVKQPKVVKVYKTAVESLEDGADAFQNLLSQVDGKVLILDFQYDECSPCQDIAPEYEALMLKYPEAIFKKVDVKKQRALLGQLDVTTIPTFKTFVGGELISSLNGSDEFPRLDKTVKGAIKTWVEENKTPEEKAEERRIAEGQEKLKQENERNIAEWKAKRAAWKETKRVTEKEAKRVADQKRKAQAKKKEEEHEAEKKRIAALPRAERLALKKEREEEQRRIREANQKKQRIAQENKKKREQQKQQQKRIDGAKEAEQKKQDKQKAEKKRAQDDKKAINIAAAEHNKKIEKDIEKDVRKIVKNVPKRDVEKKPKVVVKTVCELPFFEDYNPDVVEKIAGEVIVESRRQNFAQVQPYLH